MSIPDSSKLIATSPVKKVSLIDLVKVWCVQPSGYGTVIAWLETSVVEPSVKVMLVTIISSFPSVHQFVSLPHP